MVSGRRVPDLWVETRKFLEQGKEELRALLLSTIFPKGWLRQKVVAILYCHTALVKRWQSS